MISPDLVLRVNTDLVAGEVVDGEAVIINLGNGMYYTMAAVGAEVWRLIEGGRTLRTIAAVIGARYGIDEATVLADLEVVAQELVDEALVLIDGSVAGDTSDVDSPPPGEPYAKPTLTRYTDMGDVLALDPPLPELGAIRGDKS